MFHINTNKKLTCFYTDSGDLISYINNAQVFYSVLLKKKCDEPTNLLSNFEFVKPLITHISFSGSYAKDIFTKEKYNYCKIKNDTYPKQILLNSSKNNDKFLTSDYVVVSYLDYYYDKMKVMFNITKYEQDFDTKTNRLYNGYVYDEMKRTLNLNMNKDKTRIRK